MAHTLKRAPLVVAKKNDVFKCCGKKKFLCLDLIQFIVVLQILMSDATPIQAMES